MTREKAIEYLKSADVTVGREIKTKTAEALEMAIQALQEQKVGKWIAEGYYADFTNALAFHCSLCGGHIVDYECQVYAENPHCKWCGAKMEGAEE